MAQGLWDFLRGKPDPPADVAPARDRYTGSPPTRTPPPPPRRMRGQRHIGKYGIEDANALPSGKGGDTGY